MVTRISTIRNLFEVGHQVDLSALGLDLENQGALTNYVDKTRLVGGTGFVKCMKIFPFNSKEIISQMSLCGTGRLSKILST